jgi:hypothetical protein
MTGFETTQSDALNIAFRSERQTCIILFIEHEFLFFSASIALITTFRWTARLAWT